jgi:ATP-binding cassette subfamily C (CFTR/MRP) protein 4
LRKNVGYIPQSPFLISGTIRENLDPFQEFSDKEVIEYLGKVKLDEYVLKMPNGLLTETTEGNAQFSTGQKQLLCLARAMLLKTKIIVLDEATANVDLETDNFIQEIIKETYTQNSSATVLVIAHRLATVIDSDRILVMA